MSVFRALMDAQRRPEDEARRLTQAIGSALGDADGQLRPDAHQAAEAAVASVNQQIADEKAPPRPKPVWRSDDFEDALPDELTVEDAERSAEPSIQTDPRFVLSDEPLLAEPARSATTEAAAAGIAPPWDTGVAAEDIAARDLELEEADPTGPIELPETSDVESADEQLDTEVHHPDSADEAAPAPAVWNPHQPPSPTDLYAPLSSPWGDAAEIVTPPADTDDDGDSDDLDESSGPRPATRATDPPEDIDAPEADKGPSVPQRVRDWIESTWQDRRKTLRLAAAAVVLILVVSVIAVFSTSGSRGNPPDPAGTLTAPPPQADNPDPTVKTESLIPSEVSASCGNDSDPVAPFTHDKTRAWVCDRINDHDLNVLNMGFDKPVVITKICVVMGFNYVAPDGRDEWSRHRLGTAVTWRMGGGRFPQTINPTRTGVCKEFDSVRTQQMSMTITASTRPPVGKDQSAGIGGAGSADDPAKIDQTTAVSTIEITGYPVTPAG
ncbi:prolipoprotein diacylglyceryl transferase [Mycolicibacterium aubagnense]|uniref:Uncharacterized protein n=1 Tax=Mycolicibacterium aubagnense TaxID=319707 RepID=A0ABN5Z482_9MYCO|nr:hypothetical protein [Mycolicibacterium aubagnense]TLH64244.1 hypothetical protein C1S80_12590 [Mycolicibacterium aubagnense]BBX87884.1 hypothetical protein MAUB_57570 [Mycolicibacterium aubagnense]